MTVTVRQVAEAMLRDDTPKITGAYSKLRKEFCAVGGAARILELTDAELSNGLVRIERDGVPAAPVDSISYGGLTQGQYEEKYSSLYHAILDWNDHTELSKADIGRLILDNADDDTLNSVVIA